MKSGFTTGSCAAAASKAAAYMLLGGCIKDRISITTPKGIVFDAEILDIHRSADEVSCAVIKDGGDDPDVTTGAYIYARVAVSDREPGTVYIDGGEGVGRVTLPGLDQPVGNAAINSVPRQMIDTEVKEVMQLFDYEGSLEVMIYVPDGESIAEKTFNSRLGITGGISIIGTSGIVEPMSKQALIDTIRVELEQKHALGIKNIVIAPGNYGMDVIRTQYNYDLDKAVKCSNFIGETLDMIGDIGFENVMLCGHIGKLIKLSGGIMNTHSKEADCRMELMAAAALYAGANTDTLSDIMKCVSTDAGYEVLLKSGLAEKTMENMMERISYYLDKRSAGRFRIECIVFSNEYGLLGETAGAKDLMNGIR